MWIQNDNISAYFGDINDKLLTENNNEKQFLTLKNKIERHAHTALENIFFLKQTHINTVFVLNEKNKLQKKLDLFSHEGDAIITNQKNIAIGVVTADCIPLFLVDYKNNVIAVIHAGWKGLKVHIISATIKKMQSEFHANPADIKAYIGPAADHCCYEVKSDFLNHFSENYFNEKKGRYFFNSKKAAIDELLENKISVANMDTSHHECTICSSHYCSVRKQGALAGRQPAVIFLRP